MTAKQIAGSVCDALQNGININLFSCISAFRARASMSLKVIFCLCIGDRYFGMRVIFSEFAILFNNQS